jgi:hypothetical protein
VGARGPAPKRTDQRRRANKPEVPVDTRPGAAEVAVPKVNPQWHPLAKEWFKSLEASGQSVFYEPSDWATAKLLAETISRALKPQVVFVTKSGKVVKEAQPVKGTLLSALLKGMASLMITEGDRRRAHLELVRAQTQAGQPPAGITWIDDARDRLQRSQQQPS